MNRVYLAVDDAAFMAVEGVSRLGPSQSVEPSDLVVRVEKPWLERASTRALIQDAVQAAERSSAAAVVLLDERGELLPGLTVARGTRYPVPPGSGWIPLVLHEDQYQPDAHRAEAERYRDRIGDRLLRPEAVDPDKQHLIGDDRQRAARVLALPYQGRVLDVGTSDGTLLLEAVRRWRLMDAVGVDVAPSAIEEANMAAARDPSTAGRVQFQEGFIEELGYVDGAFDTVSACETLEHIGPGQFERAFQNLMRVLRPGGSLLMTVPNRFPDARYEREGRARWSWPAHHQYFTEQAVRFLLSPHFETLSFVPLYDDEPAGDSIYLICHASGKRP
jgi:SAM-dependent methyltransferase